jgi:Zn-dependent protease with chaperone function
MDFFEHQAYARRRTKRLMFYFAMAVVGIIVALHLGFCIAFDEDPGDVLLLGLTTAGVLITVLIGSVVKITELSKGGKVVAEMLGGVPVSASTTDPAERRLLNVVEEMSLASGTPVPLVYILDDPAINAFAAGFGTGDAAIGVTRGCIEQLSRDELQGVIGHEFSHILNGDMRLNIRLMGLLNGILFLSIIGGVLLRLAVHTRPRSSSRNEKNGNAILMFFIVAGLLLYLVGWIGVFFGKLIKAAVSREREFLADASAVQYTRNPNGIASALAKIGGATSRLQSPRAQEASHMFFGNGLAESWLNLFATHPPIRERIARIAPDFDLPKNTSIRPEPPRKRPGMPGELELAAAASMLSGLPAFSLTAAHELQGACALFYSFLLSEDAATQDKELSLIQADSAMRSATSEMFARRAELSSAQKLALADLALPALRTMSESQYKTFRTNVNTLIEADGQMRLFEYTLQKLLLRHLDCSFTKNRPLRIAYRSIVPLLPDTGLLLSAIANEDGAGPENAESSFHAGLAHLGQAKGAFPMSRHEDVHLQDFDAALDRLAQASPEVKKTILAACGAAVMSDGKVNDTQFELLRAISDTADCPLPPFVPTT